ncbi:MAG TPA: hypothetical protein VLM18_08700 [Croceibacterium sp.]|nr:hypothetical protein [Croceibacterium sp.]
MGEYEPDDSRDVTLSTHQAPGPRENEPRAMAKEQQGGADPDPADKPTARDAHGNKQPGYATNDDEADEEPPLGK